MSVEQMRQWLLSVPKYRGAIGWQRKVKAMTEKQVIAVYYRLVSTQK